jgi:hypothetical protein
VKTRYTCVLERELQIQSFQQKLAFWDGRVILANFQIFDEITSDSLHLLETKFTESYYAPDRLCGLVVSVEGYKHTGPGFDSRALLRIFLRELGLERGPLSLVIG